MKREEAETAKQEASEPVKAGGLLDNLKNVNFAKVITLAESIAADATGKLWYALLSDVGELAKVFGGLGTTDSGGAVPMMTCGPNECDKFDAACKSFEAARANCYAISIAPVKAGTPGAPVMGLDPSAILVALELAGKLFDLFKAWRQSQTATQ